MRKVLLVLSLLAFLVSADPAGAQVEWQPVGVMLPPGFRPKVSRIDAVVIGGGFLGSRNWAGGNVITSPPAFGPGVSSPSDDVVSGWVMPDVSNAWAAPLVGGAGSLVAAQSVPAVGVGGIVGTAGGWGPLAGIVGMTALVGGVGGYYVADFLTADECVLLSIGCVDDVALGSVSASWSSTGPTLTGGQTAPECRAEIHHPPDLGATLTNYAAGDGQGVTADGLCTDSKPLVPYGDWNGVPYGSSAVLRSCNQNGCSGLVSTSINLEIPTIVVSVVTTTTCFSGPTTTVTVDITWDTHEPLRPSMPGVPDGCAPQTIRQLVKLGEHTIDGIKLNWQLPIPDWCITAGCLVETNGEDCRWGGEILSPTYCDELEAEEVGPKVTAGQKLLVTDTGPVPVDDIVNVRLPIEGDPGPTTTTVTTSSTSGPTTTTTSEPPPTIPPGGPSGCEDAGGASCEADEAICYPTGWTALNPVEWVLKPLKCAFRWLFVLDAEREQEVQDHLGAAASGPPFSTIGALAASVGGSSITLAAEPLEGCLSPWLGGWCLQDQNYELPSWVVWLFLSLSAGVTIRSLATVFR